MNTCMATLKNWSPLVGLASSFASKATAGQADEYGFTNPALSLLRHGGFENGVHGRNCTCDLHLRTVAL
jgi:hypothetical protein